MTQNPIQPDRRRLISSLLASSAVLTLAGCDSDPKPSATATLINNYLVHQAVLSLDSSLSVVETYIEDFETQNWRDVVPEVKQSTNALRGALDNLKQALGYVSNA